MNLEAEKKILIDKMKETTKSMANEISNVKSTNNELEEYVKFLEKEEGFADKVKDISETKNKQRTLKAFLTRAETAMWFAKAFDLELESLKVKEAKTGKTHEVNAETKTDEPGEHSTSQNEISDTEMSRVEQIVYLLDKFCVSDEFTMNLA